MQHGRCADNIRTMTWVRSAPWHRFKPSSKIFYWPFQGGSSFVDHLCYSCFVFVSWSTSELRVRLALHVTGLIFLLNVPRRYFYCGSYVFLSCVCNAFVHVCLFVPCGHLLRSSLSFEVSRCEFVTFPLVSWVTCGTWLYRFLIFAPSLTSIILQVNYS